MCVEIYWALIIVLILTVVVHIFLFWASAFINSGVYVKTYCRAKRADKCVALTFDDSPSCRTGRVLDILKKHNVKATFFVIGSNIDEFPDVFKRIVDEGHVVGNHTWSHPPRFQTMKYINVENEIKMTSDYIQSTIGKRPLFFRPPFGVTTPRIGRAVRKLGMSCIGWNIRSLDTVEKRTREEIVERVIPQIKPGSVILLHDRCKDSDRLLEMLFQYLDDNGYKVKTVEEMFNLKAYV